MLCCVIIHYSIPFNPIRCSWIEGRRLAYSCGPPCIIIIITISVTITIIITTAYITT